METTDQPQDSQEPQEQTPAAPTHAEILAVHSDTLQLIMDKIRAGEAVIFEEIASLKDQIDAVIASL